MTKKPFPSLLTLACLSHLILSGSLHAQEAEVPVLSLGLDQTIEDTLSSSPRYQSARLDYESAQSKAKSQVAVLYPKLSLDGFYRYQTEVPEFTPAPGAPKQRFGDNENYSVGPAVSWNVWSSGGNYNRWKGAIAAAESKFFDWDVVHRQLVLEARLAYFRVQLALEQTRAVSESLLLAQRQYKDISLQHRAGALSRIDLLSAHDEVLTRRRELREARADLAQGLRELFALTGMPTEKNLSIPFINSSEKMPEDTEPPTVRVETDPLEKTFAIFQLMELTSLDVNHPQIETLEKSAEAAHRLAQSLNGLHGPNVQLRAAATSDYPNGPVIEHINQQTFLATASWSIFEFKRVVNEVKSQEAQAESLEMRKEQTMVNLQRDWDQTQDRLLALIAEQELNRISLKEAKTLVTLVYDAYKAGQSTHLELERANLRALLADVRSAQNQVQILIQRASLDSLAAPRK